MRGLSLLLGLAIGLVASAASSVPFRAMSFNLHGYHPLGEAPRYLETRDGRRTAVAPDIYYFRPEELFRGHRRRLDALAADVLRLKPDLLVLQEVGASLPTGPKDCAAFYAAHEGDGDGVNAALRIYRRLGRGREAAYSLALACRGNTGWITDERTFRDVRVVKPVPEGGGFEVVYDFGANPYPHGVIVEGFAALVRKPWRLAEVRRLDLTTNFKGDRFIAELLVLERESHGTLMRVLAVNVHAGHKLANFEQAVALRETLATEVAHLERAQKQNKARPIALAGVIVLGDFNGELYRPAEGHGEVAMSPWELRLAGEYDFSHPESAPELRAQLKALNEDQSYKPWATVTDAEEAHRRIVEGVDRYFRGLRRWNAQLTETLWKAGGLGLCQGFGIRSCVEPDRIDHIFVDDRVELKSAGIYQATNIKEPLQGFSDHPGVWADLELTNPFSFE